MPTDGDRDVLIIVESNHASVVAVQPNCNSQDCLGGARACVVNQNYAISNTQNPHAASWAPDGSVLVVACSRQVQIFVCLRQHLAKVGYREQLSEVAFQRESTILADADKVTDTKHEVAVRMAETKCADTTTQAAEDKFAAVDSGIKSQRPSIDEKVGNRLKPSRAESDADDAFVLMLSIPLYYIPKDVSVAICDVGCSISCASQDADSRDGAAKIPPSFTYKGELGTKNSSPYASSGNQDGSTVVWYSIAVAGPDGVELHTVALQQPESFDDLKDIRSHTQEEAQPAGGSLLAPLASYVIVETSGIASTIVSQIPHHAHTQTPDPQLLHESLAVAHVSHSNSGKQLAVGAYDGHLDDTLPDCAIHICRLDNENGKPPGSKVVAMQSDQVRIGPIAATTNNNMPGGLLVWRGDIGDYSICVSQATLEFVGILEYRIRTDTCRFRRSTWDLAVKGLCAGVEMCGVISKRTTHHNIYSSHNVIYCLTRGGHLLCLPDSVCSNSAETVKCQPSDWETVPFRVGPTSNFETNVMQSVEMSTAILASITRPKMIFILHDSKYGTIYVDNHGILHCEVACICACYLNDSLEREYSRMQATGNERLSRKTIQACNLLTNAHTRLSNSAAHELRSFELYDLPFIFPKTSGSTPKETASMDESYITITIHRTVYVLPREHHGVPSCTGAGAHSCKDTQTKATSKLGVAVVFAAKVSAVRILRTTLYALLIGIDVQGNVRIQDITDYVNLRSEIEKTAAPSHTEVTDLENSTLTAFDIIYNTESATAVCEGWGATVEQYSERHCGSIVSCATTKRKASRGEPYLEKDSILRTAKALGRSTDIYTDQQANGQEHVNEYETTDRLITCESIVAVLSTGHGVTIWHVQLQLPGVGIAYTEAHSVQPRVNPHNKRPTAPNDTRMNEIVSPAESASKELPIFNITLDPGTLYTCCGVHNAPNGTIETVLITEITSASALEQNSCGVFPGVSSGWG
ncbi:hypothetical protein SARC_00899 [Sphaeroforma arctica JP610]|uniref:Uncharacterized protein n=1 Tax=Sphaeroforma arctica JP610 TaxID=667725 RepID=A0A0L0GF73_9EUKA|nr:hypothetical protein SARC_00899 [Sphaeroforma arctica JP610]KNC86948.1 hypothetical protein SARC_00899 [Sphaeroforma arctica JP610]|eukprot:XP_014160850.1 hypothetical protein SARC_00899 [Sphaeroforma arctica JP610]